MSDPKWHDEYELPSGLKELSLAQDLIRAQQYTMEQQTKRIEELEAWQNKVISATYKAMAEMMNKYQHRVYIPDEDHPRRKDVIELGVYISMITNTFRARQHPKNEDGK